VGEVIAGIDDDAQLVVTQHMAEAESQFSTADATA